MNASSASAGLLAADEAIAAHGRGDYATALRLFRDLAEQGNADAQFHLGRMYARGEGIPRDHAIAALWYHKAAEQGDYKAQHNLALAYQAGDGVPQDLAACVYWLTKAAEQGSARSQVNLGLAYHHGRGVARDDAQASSWFQKAADQGDVRAQHNLGYMYRFGLGVPQDYKVAMAWYREAVDQGHPEAQYAVGRLYADALGVPRDYVEAAKWFRRAAEQGLAQAQHSLGLACLLTQGVPQDLAAARYWFRRAADQGDSRAQHSLGYMSLRGEGTPKDFNAAAFWLLKAADQGNARSQHALGMMYFDGQGVAQDCVQAWRWLDLAVAASENSGERELHDVAVEARDAVARRMSRAQIDEAQQLAREWKPKTAAQSVNKAALAAARAWHLCDAALAAYAALSSDSWRGRQVFPGGEIVFPDPERAHALLGEAKEAAEGSDIAGSIRLLDEALRLDYVTALNEDNCLVLRAKAYLAAGSNEPVRALGLYSIGCTLCDLEHWREAGAVYQAAADLDPLFAWHLNNFAWMAATSPDLRAQDGQLAVTLAARACEISGWGCWCFVGTLAAAFARAGDFRRAVEWQRIYLRLAPSHEQGEAQQMLRQFETGEAYIDRDRKPAAGGPPSSKEELAQVDVRELLTEAQELIGTQRALVQ